MCGTISLSPGHYSGSHHLQSRMPWFEGLCEQYSLEKGFVLLLSFPSAEVSHLQEIQVIAWRNLAPAGSLSIV